MCVCVFCHVQTNLLMRMLVDSFEHEPLAFDLMCDFFLVFVAF